MKYIIELSDRADRDLRMIILWISKHSLAGAKTWMDRWDELLTQLEESADSCPLAPENDDHQETIRHQIFKIQVPFLQRDGISIPIIH